MTIILLTVVDRRGAAVSKPIKEQLADSRKTGKCYSFTARTSTLEIFNM